MPDSLRLPASRWRCSGVSRGGRRVARSCRHGQRTAGIGVSAGCSLPRPCVRRSAGRPPHFRRGPVALIPRLHSIIKAAAAQHVSTSTPEPVHGHRRDVGGGADPGVLVHAGHGSGHDREPAGQDAALRCPRHPPGHRQHLHRNTHRASRRGRGGGAAAGPALPGQAGGCLPGGVHPRHRAGFRYVQPHHAGRQPPPPYRRPASFCPPTSARSWAWR